MERECSKCKKKFIVRECQTWWDYGGFDYDTKLINCPLCGCINILGYYEYPNRDAWFYEYGGRRTHVKKEIGKYLPKD